MPPVQKVTLNPRAIMSADVKDYKGASVRSLWIVSNNFGSHIEVYRLTKKEDKL
jgi:hypothetical protein